MFEIAFQFFGNPLCFSYKKSTISNLLHILQNMEITIRENIEFGTQELEIFCNVQGHRSDWGRGD